MNQIRLQYARVGGNSNKCKVVNPKEYLTLKIPFTIFTCNKKGQHSYCWPFCFKTIIMSRTCIHKELAIFKINGKITMKLERYFDRYNFDVGYDKNILNEEKESIMLRDTRKELEEIGYTSNIRLCKRLEENS